MIDSLPPFKEDTQMPRAMLPTRALNAMKFFNYNTANAFAQPSVRGWLVVFVCGFLTVCIVGPLLWIALWLFVKILRLLRMASAPVWEVSVGSAAGVIFTVAAVFGALLATVMVLGLARRNQRESRTPGHHAVIGDFEHSAFHKTWHAQPMLPTGKTVNVSAFGQGPSEVQAALWQQFIGRHDELIAEATHSLLAEGHPLEGCEKVTLTPTGITLTRDGKLHMGFEFATVPEDFWESEADAPYPTASFTSALELKSTEWLRPYG